MPRKTHPKGRAKHARSHIREMRERKALIRFNRAKRIYGDYYTLLIEKDPATNQVLASSTRLDEFVHPNDIRRSPDRYANFVFSRYTSEWSKNWQTYCSCIGCSKHHYDPISRAVRERGWKEDWHNEMTQIQEETSLQSD